MFRLGSFLMMIVLTAPMVRECCLPVQHSFPCHEQKHTDDITCDANPQAVTVSKSALDVRISLAFDMLRLHQATPASASAIGQIPARAGLDASPPTDIYFRTGALLI
jgi:hypothetical protein